MVKVRFECPDCGRGIHLEMDPKSHTRIICLCGNTHDWQVLTVGAQTILVKSTRGFANKEISLLSPSMRQKVQEAQ